MLNSIHLIETFLLSKFNSQSGLYVQMYTCMYSRYTQYVVCMHTHIMAKWTYSTYTVNRVYWHQPQYPGKDSREQ